MAVETSQVSITTSVVISEYINYAAQKAGFNRPTGPKFPSFHCDKCKMALNILLIAKCNTCNETNLIDDTVEACAHIGESRVLRELCDEAVTRSPWPFDELCSQIKNPVSMHYYWNVLDTLMEFPAGVLRYQPPWIKPYINWWRIVHVVSFAGVLAGNCSKDADVNNIIEWTCSFFAMKVDTWIEDQTGWGGMAALKEEDTEESQDGKQISDNVYFKPKQSWIIDHDQKLCEIEKSVTKSDRRNTTDSDMDTHGGKRKRKRTVSDDQLSCHSSQTSPWQLPGSPSQWSICSDPNRISDHSRMSSQSPILSDISDMGSQRPMGVHNGKTVVESVIPNMEEFTSTMIPSVVSSIAGDDLMGGEIQKTLESFMSPVSSMADSFQSSQRSMFLIGNATQIAGNQTMMQQFQGGLGSQFTTEVQGQHNFGFTEMLQSEDGNNITVYIEDQPADQGTSHGIQRQPNADLVFEMIGKMSLEEQQKIINLLTSAQTQTKSRPSTSTTRQTDSGGSYTLSSGEIQEGMNSGSIDPLFTDIIAGSSSSTSN